MGSEQLSKEQREQIEKKVREFFPEFLARIDKPNKQYALQVAIELIVKELKGLPTEEGKEDSDLLQRISDYADCVRSKREAPKGEREQLKDAMMKQKKKNSGFY